ncbi:Wall-associated receptor kinase, galacturonan-binding domain [Dillenia turbinata]|uniref:Wall-associated receptor kinase, galacturonan-binding domain n=1 Tax=Dillenia turbinata TaxID=194707 RepID=A0AAN8VBL8_9MAGN
MKMKLKKSFLALLSISLSLIILPPVLSQSCKRFCGNQHVQYPFGTGPGCGDPRFQPYLTCIQQELTFTTHTGTYPITSIDYHNQVMYIYDPTMSICACSQPSKDFSLDCDAPFTFSDNTIFGLLDCFVSSPIFKSNGVYSGGNSTSVPLCDNQGSEICTRLYSCQPTSKLSLPVSTCCIYTPVDLGPQFDLDLQKLQCSFYSAIYGYNEQDSDQGRWNYGVALKYKFNVNNDYPSLYADCEKSLGACGYIAGDFYSFLCSCPNGMNTSTNCYFMASWNNARPLHPVHAGIK